MAILIAVSAALGATTAWRASSASIRADEHDRAGFHLRIEDITSHVQVIEDREQSAASYLRWLAYSEFARALRAEAQHATPSSARSLGAQALIETSVATSARALLPVEARVGRRKINLNRADRFKLAELQRETQGGGASVAFRAADRLRAKAERLVLVAALFIVAAVAFTLAQVRTKSDYRMWLAIGLIILLGSMIAGIYLDLGT